jgi:hypothetical protein
MLNRRNVLFGAVAGAAGVTLLRAGRGRAQATPPTRNLFVILASGGWDTTYSIDPKPGLDTVDIPAGSPGTYGDLDVWLPTSPTGSIDAFFRAYAPMTALVRGISIRSIAHPECRKRILTGGPSSESPDFAAICAHELGRELPLPYLVLGDDAFTGPLGASAGRVGATNQITALLDPAKAYDAPPGAPYAQPAFVPTGPDEEAIRAFVTARAERERAVRGARGYNKARLDDFQSSLERSDRLRPYAAGFGERGRNLQLDDQAALAAQVVEQGIARAVMLDSRIAWDTHDGNEEQGLFHDALFGSLKRFLDDLSNRPGARAGSTLLDESVVVVVSEMSRTPKLNARGGKDHWPVTSAVVVGAGVRGGRAYGATSDRMEAMPVDLATGQVAEGGATIQTNNLAAGLLHLVGIDPERYFPGVEPLRALGPA